MQHRARFIPLVVLLLAIVGGTWWWARTLRAQDGALAASGTIEAVELAISPEQGGRVVAVSVAAGDRVEAGQLLVQLDTALLDAQLAQARANLQVAQANHDLLAAGASAPERAAAEAWLAAARANPDLVLARQALEDLYEQTTLAAAQAQFSLARAEDRLDATQRHLNSVIAPDIAFYQERVTDAEEALTMARQNVELADIGEVLGGVQTARDNLDRFEELLGKVRTAIESCPDCDPERVVTVDGRPWTLDDAQDAYNDALHAVREAEIRLDQARTANTNAVEAAEERLGDALQDLAWAQADPNTIDLALASAEVAVAESVLADARADWELLRQGPDPKTVAVAEARIAFSEANLAAAQAQLELVAAGPRVEQLAVARAQVEAARAAVALLELQLTRQALVSPVAGIVLSRSVEPGELALPGATLLTIGQLDQLTIVVYVSEDRYGAISVGQDATLAVDSFPEQSFAATVRRIADKAEFTPRNVQTAEGRATTVFAVELAISGGAGQLRPGMPADVIFGRQP